MPPVAASPRMKMGLIPPYPKGAGVPWTPGDVLPTCAMILEPRHHRVPSVLLPLKV